MFELALLFALLFPAGGTPERLKNAQATTRPASAAGLAEEVRALGTAGTPVWIGYEQDVLDGDRQMCCFGSLRSFRQERSERLCCGGCRLEQEESFSIGRDDDAPTRLEPPARFLVLLRVEGGRVGRVRALSEDCSIDAGGRPFLWLTDVTDDESLRFLGSLVGPLAKAGGDRDRSGEALAAIAMHASPEADSVLEGFVERGNPRELRKNAAFWLGNERGRRGFEIIRAHLSDPDLDFRRHLTFCLSQSREPEALVTLMEMARADRDGEVRGQALFWLAQKASDRAAKTIQNAIRDDPDEEVKKKAVFALSQLPGEQAVTELIRVARTNRNLEVRKQAIFWLGQSRDPRALAFIEEILER
jgi:hypothetical protein